MHQEPADLGDVKEEMDESREAKAEMRMVEVQDAEEIPLPHMTINVMEGTEAVSTQECVIQEAWHGWWESLRMAHRMQWVMAAALWDKSRGKLMVHVKKLTQEEAENFEENGMEVDAFGMEEWAD